MSYSDRSIFSAESLFSGPEFHSIGKLRIVSTDIPGGGVDAFEPFMFLRTQPVAYSKVSRRVSPRRRSLTGAIDIASLNLGSSIILSLLLENALYVAEHLQGFVVGWETRCPAAATGNSASLVS